MSCWVVPTVAAELWGVPLEQVLAAARDGRVPWKRDYNFVVVDVAPDSPVCPSPAARPQRPPTFRPAAPAPSDPPALSADEAALLAEEADDDASDADAAEPGAEQMSGDWRDVRARTAFRRLRRCA